MPPPFPLTPTSSDGDPFCTQEFCDYEDIYRTRFFQLNTLGGGGSVSSNPNRDYTESVMDTDGSVYATHYWTASHAYGSPPYCLGPVVTRVSDSSTDASVLWTKQYKCSDGFLMRGEPARIILDIYGNLWLVYAVCSANGTATVAGVSTFGPYDLNVNFLRISKSTGTLLFHKSFKVTIYDNGEQAKGISKVLQDPYGNWYIASSHVIGDASWHSRFNVSNPADQGNVFARVGWIIKLNYGLAVQWGVRWAGSSFYYGVFGDQPGIRSDASTIFESMSYASNALYITTRVGQSGANSTAPNFLKVNTQTGSFENWPKLDYTINIPYRLLPRSNSVVTDSYNNMYAALQDTWDYNTQICVLKFNTSGVLQWAREFYVDDDFGSAYANQFGAPIISITVGNRIFIAADKFNESAISTYILEITTSGQIVSTRRYRNGNAYYNTIYSMSTYSYSPNTLLCKFSGGDHVDTTTNVEVFNVPQRTVVSLTNLPSPVFTPNPRVSDPQYNTWGSVYSDFAASTTSFTVTTPDRTTRLFDIGKIRD